MKKKQFRIAKAFGDFANTVARIAGRPSAFIAAFVIVLAWGASGPVFHFSDTWQLVINTGTTIVTFLMVFLIQNSQNRTRPPVPFCEQRFSRRGGLSRDWHVRRLSSVVEGKGSLTENDTQSATSSAGSRLWEGGRLGAALETPAAEKAHSCPQSTLALKPFVAALSR